MGWTRDHGSFLIREVLIADPFKYKQPTIKKGQAFPQFPVSQCSVPERFTTLEKNFTKKMKRKQQA